MVCAPGDSLRGAGIKVQAVQLFHLYGFVTWAAGHLPCFVHPDC